MRGCVFINISCENVIADYSDLVYRIAVTHVKSRQDADDIFQDVFISLIKNINDIDNEEHLKHWLIRATINRTKNFNLCFWKRRVELHTEDLSITIFDSQDEGEMIDRVREEISALPRKLKSVVYLYYYEDYSVNEIATILKVPNGTIKSRLHTARNTLKIRLKEVYDNEPK